MQRADSEHETLYVTAYHPWGVVFGHPDLWRLFYESGLFVDFLVYHGMENVEDRWPSRIRCNRRRSIRSTLRSLRLAPELARIIQAPCLSRKPCDEVRMALDPIQKASRDQFERQSAKYGKSHILANTNDIALALEEVEVVPGSRALDVATGGGHTALYLASRGFSVTASDISQKMLDSAKALAAERGFSIETRLHEAEKLPYSDAAYDLVSCRVAAHHFSDRESFLSEVMRVLKPGGYFLLIDGSVPDGEPIAEEWIHELEKLRDPSHGRFLSPDSWKELCRRNQLRVVRCETTPFKQPDLNWYFETAGTPPENRKRILELVDNAPDSARRVFRIAEEGGKIVWWWTRLSLVARK
jgi:ubiquinone/menaquinone biosynthesis C-methylase UbiE